MEEKRIIGVVGLGLIGGSFVKAYHEAGWSLPKSAERWMMP